MRAGQLLLSAWVTALALGCGKTTGDERARQLAFVADTAALDWFELHVVSTARPDSVRTLSAAAGPSLYEAEWSPDGRFIAFGAQPLVAADVENDFAVHELAAEGWNPRWSASGRWVAFTVSEPAPALIVKDLHHIEPDSVQPVSEGPPSHGWSPARDELFFAADVEHGEVHEWYLLVPGEAAHPFGVLNIGSPLARPSWSPDGGSIALAANGRLYAVHTADRPLVPRVLFESDDDIHFHAWSGDGSLLVVRTSPEVWTVPAEGGPATLVAAQTFESHVVHRGRDLVYLGAPGRDLRAHSLSGGRASEVRLLEPRAVNELVVSESSDVILYALEAEPARVQRVRTNGTWHGPLHDAQTTHSPYDLGALTPAGNRALLELEGSPEHELVVVDVQSARRVLSIASSQFAFDQARWADSAHFSFLHGPRAWQSLHIADSDAGTVNRVYTKASNLREIRWTGWQP